MKHPKAICRAIAGLMLLLAAGFVRYALGHPEGSFSWPSGVTYALYGLYLAVVLILFIAPTPKRKLKEEE